MWNDIYVAQLLKWLNPAGILFRGILCCGENVFCLANFFQESSRQNHWPALVTVCISSAPHYLWWNRGLWRPEQMPPGAAPINAAFDSHLKTPGRYLEIKKKRKEERYSHTADYMTAGQQSLQIWLNFDWGKFNPNKTHIQRSRPTTLNQTESRIESNLLHYNHLHYSAGTRWEMNPSKYLQRLAEKGNVHQAVPGTQGNLVLILREFSPKICNSIEVAGLEDPPWPERGNSLLIPGCSLMPVRLLVRTVSYLHSTSHAIGSRAEPNLALGTKFLMFQCCWSKLRNPIRNESELKVYHNIFKFMCTHTHTHLL